MAPTTILLTGGNLGQRHQFYNALVNDAIKNNEASIIDTNDNDMVKLFKIDIASHNKDVEYILSVFKSNDLMCVSRAIKKATWLITDNQYAYIINADYVYTKLFPSMTSKAICKLKKHIRLHLRDESRVEEFYKREDNRRVAVKWLPRCSVNFIDQEAKKIKYIKPYIFKRLCEKSPTVLGKMATIYESQCYGSLTTDFYRIKDNVNDYLDMVEKNKSNFPKFGKRGTKIIMKTCPERVITNYAKYVSVIDVKTFAKYLKPEDIKEFLFDQCMRMNSDIEYSNRYCFVFNNFRLIINRMPETERFAFIKQVFIDKIHTRENNEPEWPKDSDMYKMKILYDIVIRTVCNKNNLFKNTYSFYVFASFEVALTEIRNIIKTNPTEDCNPYLDILITCARNNMTNVKSILEFYNEKLINNRIQSKIAFIQSLFTRTNILRYDDSIWCILETLFEQMEVYSKSDLNMDIIVEAILLHKVVNGQEVPVIIKEKFQYNTLNKFKKNLNAVQKNNVFNYLFNIKFNELQTKIVNNEKECTLYVTEIENVLNLLTSWDKELRDFPLLLNCIKKIAKDKNEKSWNVDLSSIYNFKKSWKQLMFEESLVLSLTEKTCVNALKHNPEILNDNSSAIEALRCNDAVSLQQFNRKLRMYWPETIALDWKTAYLDKVGEEKGHKARARGICTLLSQSQLTEILHRYAPENPKIVWDNIDAVKLGLQRQLAKSMHVARPHPSPDTIIMYAKGDYLQYALPSLLAIFYNLSVDESRIHLHKILNAPVSLQKHSIRLAFVKLTAEELKPIFLNIWKTTKNPIIRSILFKYTYTLLCKESDTKKITELWSLLEMYIDNLNLEENEAIYELLRHINKINKVPIKVRANYIIKSYYFLQKLIPTREKDRDHYDYCMNDIIRYFRDIMDHLPSEFVSNVILERIKENEIGATISAYLLFSGDEYTQMERYKKVFVPYFETDRSMESLLDQLSDDFKEIIMRKNKINPYKMFSEIEKLLESKLNEKHNYVLLRKWKLTTEFVRILKKYNMEEGDEKATCMANATEFGTYCISILRKDVEKYFPCIYVLFSEALESVISKITNDIKVKYEIYKHFLSDQDCVCAYLIVINVIKHCCKNEETEELRRSILQHPSQEVKIHYHFYSKDYDEYYY